MRWTVFLYTHVCIPITNQTRLAMCMCKHLEFFIPMMIPYWVIISHMSMLTVTLLYRLMYCLDHVYNIP